MAERESKPNAWLGAAKLGLDAAVSPITSGPVNLAKFAASRVLPDSVKRAYADSNLANFALSRALPDSVKPAVMDAIGYDEDREEATGAIAWGALKAAGEGVGVSPGGAAMRLANAYGAAADAVTGDEGENSVGRRFGRGVRKELIHQEDENPGLVGLAQAGTTVGMAMAGVGAPGMAVRGQGILAAKLAGAGGGALRNVAGKAAAGVAVGGIESALQSGLESASRQSLRTGEVDYGKVYADSASGGAIGALLGGTFAGVAGAAGEVGKRLTGDKLRLAGSRQYLREAGVSGQDIRRVEKAAGDKATQRIGEVMDDVGLSQRGSHDDIVEAAAKRASAIDEEISGLRASEVDFRRQGAASMVEEAKLQADDAIVIAKKSLAQRAAAVNSQLESELAPLRARLGEIASEEASSGKNFSRMAFEDTAIQGIPRGGIPRSPRDEITNAGIMRGRVKPSEMMEDTSVTREFGVPGQPPGGGGFPKNSNDVGISDIAEATAASPLNAGIRPGRGGGKVLLDEATNVSPAAASANRLKEVEYLNKQIDAITARYSKKYGSEFQSAGKTIEELEAARPGEVAKAEKAADRILSGDVKLSGPHVEELEARKRVFQAIAASKPKSEFGQAINTLRRWAGKSIGGAAGYAVGGPVGAVVGIGAESALEHFVPHFASRGMLRAAGLAEAIGGTMRMDAAARAAVDSTLGTMAPMAISNAVSGGFISSAPDKNRAMNETLGRIGSVGPQEIEKLSQVLSRPGMPPSADPSVKIATIVQNIKDNAPKPAVDAGPFQPRPQYSDSDIYAFEDYASVALDPAVFMKAVRAGSVSPQMTRAMRDNWPEVYKSMNFHALDRIGGMAEPPSMQAVRTLEIMTGEAILPENRPDNTKFFQQAHQEDGRTNQPGSQGGGSRAASKAVKSIQLPSDSLGAVK